jgi:hypothetical protein
MVPCWVGVGSGRCDTVLGGNDGIGLEENPGPLTLIEGAAALVGCEGGSKLNVGAAVCEVRIGGLVIVEGPLTFTDGLFGDILSGSMLIVETSVKAGTSNATSGSSGSTMLGILGSSGTTIVGIGGIGELNLLRALMVGVGTCDVRCTLSRGGSILGMACLLKGDDLGESEIREGRGGVEEADGMGAIVGTRVSSRTISFCCFQL